MRGLEHSAGQRGAPEHGSGGRSANDHALMESTSMRV